jgi:hypothetical protein
VLHSKGTISTLPVYVRQMWICLYVTTAQAHITPGTNNQSKILSKRPQAHVHNISFSFNYDWAQKAMALHNTRLEEIARDKHFSFLGPFVSYNLVPRSFFPSVIINSPYTYDNETILKDEVLQITTFGAKVI